MSPESAQSSETRGPLVRERAGRRLVLTCEHASHSVPVELGDLGLDAARRRDHIGWDLGAAMVTESLSRSLDAPAVLSEVSRLVVDCNRSLTDLDLIPEVSHEIAIPANRALGAAERLRRLQLYYEPFHAEVDRVLAVANGAALLSVHSFTPEYDGRGFDIGVLFDDHEFEAQELASRLRAVGFRVRMNEPYSGREGLIFSAQKHGRRHDRLYLEIEINNGLVRTDAAAESVSDRIAQALDRFID